MRPVFADPKTDFVFKRIFGSEAHKALLIELPKYRAGDGSRPETWALASTKATISATLCKSRRRVSSRRDSSLS